MSAIGTAARFAMKKAKGVLPVAGSLAVNHVASMGGFGDLATLALAVLFPEAALLEGALLVGGKLIGDHMDKKESREEQEAEAQATRDTIEKIRANKNKKEARQQTAGLREKNATELQEAIARRGTFQNTEADDHLWGTVNQFLGTGFETTGTKAERRNEELIARLEADQKDIEKNFGAPSAGEKKSSDAKRKKRIREDGQRSGQAGAAAETDDESDESPGATSPAKSARGRRKAKAASEAGEPGRPDQGAARLVSARSGSREIARAALLGSMAARQASSSGGAGCNGDGGTRNGLEAIHSTMKQQHMEALGHLSRAQFTRRWPRR
jgi:hypothetical protein